MNERQRLLVIDPHPDDEAIYFGGTLAKAAESGKEIFLLVVTNGEKGKLSIHHPEWGYSLAHTLSPKEQEQAVNERQQECLNAAAILGIQHVKFLGFPDTGVDENLIGVLTEQVEEVNPHVIISFSEAGTSYEPNKADHAWTGIAANAAIRVLLGEEFKRDLTIRRLAKLPHPSSLALGRYVTYTLPDAKDRFDNWAEIDIPPEDLITVDVTAQLGKKLKAVYSHKSQNHLIRFFHSVGLLHQSPEYFMERISLSPTAKSQTDIFYGVEEKLHSPYISPFPLQGNIYKSNHPIFDHTMFRYNKARQVVRALNGNYKDLPRAA